MATLLLFGPARSAAGIGRLVVEAATVAGLLEAASAQFGPAFAAVVARSALWVNGTPADGATALAPGDEVAVVPPVSGGS